MTLENREEFENTRSKVNDLQRIYDRARERPESNPVVRELTLRSLGGRIKRMREEMIRFEIEEAKRLSEGEAGWATFEGVVRNGVVEIVGGTELPEGSHVTVCAMISLDSPKPIEKDAPRVPGLQVGGMSMSPDASEHLPDDSCAGTR
jgi:hypothetical protein